MKIGTKSLLFGAHQFLLHPVFLFIAWWRLYGFPWDPRLWVAFVVHDWGYWGKPNMDGPEGETHPLLGARIMGRLFDPKPEDHHVYKVVIYLRHIYDGTPLPDEAEIDAALTRWHDFALYHSRFYAKAAGKPFSRLCVADKLAIAITPWWLYLPSVWLTGELAEYMALADKRRAAGEHSLNSAPMAGATPREWHRRMTAHCRAWAYEHADCRPDTWTPAPKQAGGRP